MPLTQLSNIVDPRVFAAYTQEVSTNLSLLIKSGVVANSPALDAFVAGGGTYIDLPFWDDLDDTEANSSTDAVSDMQTTTNPIASDAVPRNIATGRQTARRFNRNQNWSAADLAGQIAGSDPMAAIANRVAEYWVRQDQLLINNTISGLVKAYPSGGANAIEHDITAGAGAVTSVNTFSADALLDTFQLLGDHKSNVRAVAVHSVIHTVMQKLNLIDFVADSEANIGFGTYMGKSLIVDDNLWTQTTAPNTEYFTVCYGPGAFLLGNGSPRVPAEVTRFALAGAGGGQEVLTSRREFCLHPAGFAMDTNLSGLASGVSATNAQVNHADAYDLAVARKRVPLAVLNTNAA